MPASQQDAAVIVGAPYGGVKEQGRGIHAQNLARRGFLALAFDPSCNGWSGGYPRHVSSADIFTEDFSAAVDHLGTHDVGDRDRIGVVGICGSGGFALSAARVDRRIKAIATVVTYDIARVAAEGRQGSAHSGATQSRARRAAVRALRGPRPALAGPSCRTGRRGRRPGRRGTPVRQAGRNDEPS
ncbi:alpha/beta hydrolase [Streptomyces canus]|uniref:alpha/beta hydrolase n=1 Tax=Streptomyces canus TaxID=58343 RepID=UPI0032565006